MSQIEAERTPGAETAPRRRENLIVLAIIGVHLCITVPLGLWLNVWIDEIYAFVTTSRSFAYAMDHTVTFQGHPPVFYILLWGWRQIHPSIEFARMFPVIVIAATLWIVHLNVRRWFPLLPTPWVVLPLAVNPWMIYAAVEVRLYCLIPFWAATVTYFFHAGFIETRPRLTSRIAFALSAILGVYTFYYVGFMLPGGALALLIWRKWRSLRDYIVVMIACGLVILPQFLLSLRDTELYTASLIEMPSMVRALEFSLARVADSVSGIFEFPQKVRLVLFLMILGGLGLAALIRVRHWDLQSSAIPVMCLTVALGYFALIRFVMGENVFFRHFVGATVPLHLTAVAVADRFGTRRRAILAVFMAVLLATCAASSIIRYRPLAKIGDYRAVGNYLQAEEGANEPILVAANHAEYPLRVYYDGVNEIVPIPRHDDLETYNVANWRIDDPQQVVDALGDIETGGSVWVFTDREPDAQWANNPLNLHILEDVLEENFVLQTERQFYGAKVRKFRRK